jgi:hypothetical protein
MDEMRLFLWLVVGVTLGLATVLLLPWLLLIVLADVIADARDTLTEPDRCDAGNEALTDAPLPGVFGRWVDDWNGKHAND